ncbi:MULTISPECIES: biopolymer transporter ExbD [Gulbenkiania]|uniref:Biopolymer transport protein ExbD n=2 Tax=Gulbenkiania TaxID=397456 RepID=A0A0K6GYJ6_9NEIS|nr:MULTISPECIES: biopolymer transporter ExbD [Gulbenkiania]TCW32803.1 biopolymer transport protein TolR [Gulbenkiania mobilis]CUA83635.1 Biopolymer transport protein ExbD [Gulbenkiania indica]
MLNRRPRRQMNQMNVVPYIDVMLVLLVIFMVTAPMFTPGVIEVPSVSKAPALAQKPVEVAIDASGAMTVRVGETSRPVESVDTLAETLRTVRTDDAPVVISAHRDLKYADVVRVADALHMAGINKVALTVKQP